MDIRGQRVLTPSKGDFWNGTPDAAGQFTREQQVAVQEHAAKCRARKWRGWDGAIYHVVLKTRKPHPMNSYMEVTETIRVACPLLRVTKTGRLVIAPNGMEKWVDREGDNR